MNDVIDGNDAEWADQGEAPKKKRRFPRWLLAGCGCGCLTVLVLVGAVAWFVKEGMDPDVQWPKINEVLPFDERPTDLQVTMGFPSFISGIKVFTLMDLEDKYTANIQVFTGANATESEMLFSPDGGQIPGGWAEPVGAVLGEMDLQGRTVRVLTFESIKGTGGIENLGGGMRVDLSQNEGELRMVELRTANGADALSDEQLADFFDHFDIWR